MSARQKNLEQTLKNLRVNAFTTPCPKVVSPEATLKELEELMKAHSIRHIPVVDDNQKIVGILSERDIYFVYRLGLTKDCKARDIMHKNPYQVHCETKISEVAFYMSENKYGSALVTGPGEKDLGVFTTTDALNALIEILRGDILTED